MKMCRYIAALMALVMLICALPAFADIDDNYITAYVNKTNTTVYQKASSSSKKLGTYSYCEPVKVVKYNRSWAQITYGDGAIGYIKTPELTTKNPAVSPVDCYSMVNGLNVYSRASITSTVLGTLNFNDKVEGVAITPDWKFLRFEWEGGYAFAERSCFSLEPASNPETVYVKTTTAPLMKTRSTSAAKTGTAYFGEEFTMNRLEGSWAYITNGAVSGWCKTSYLSYNSQATVAMVYSAKKSGIPVYARNAKMLIQLDTLDYGDEVIVLGFTPDNVYAMVDYEDTYAYVQSAYLKYVGKYVESEEDGDIIVDGTVPDATVIYITANNVTAYKEPSSSAKKAGTVSFGEELTLVQTSGNWALVENSVGQGWILKDTISTENPCTSEKTYYINASKSTVYQRPVTNAKVLGYLKLNNEVTVVGKTGDGEWCRVEYSGGYGFIKAGELSETKSATAESITVYVEVNNATAYKKASASSSKAGTVSYGEVLTCTKVSGDWALVSNSVGQGWVKKSALSTKNPCTASLTGYVKSTTAVVYQRPGTSYKKLATLPMNAEVIVVGRTSDKNWYRVEYDGGYGFMKTSSLTGSKPSSGVKVYVRYNVVEAYETSSSSSKKVGEVYYGQELTRISISREWALVTNGSSQGWVKLDALTSQNPNTSGNALYTAKDGIIVRKKPDSEGAKLTTFDKGDVVVGLCITPDGKWVRIKYNTGFAFVAVSDLTTKSPYEYQDPYAGTSGDDSIERVVALAIAQYGKPYIYADEGPDSYDCSGLVQYCFKKITGIVLLRSGHAQGYDSRWPRIEKISDLKRGDVVVFDTIEDGDDYSDHTGIYLGGGLFVHASSGAGKVTVSNLNSGFYNRKFSWGLRIIK